MSQNSKIQLRGFVSVDDTLKEVYKMINSEYQKDYLNKFDSLNLKQVFNYVSALPYVPDPTNDLISGYDDIEFVKSPYYTNYFGGDCDDKSVFIGAVMKRRGIPFRFAVTSNKDNQELHHIYPELFINDIWVPFDATYSYNTPFTESDFTKKRIYDDNCGYIQSFEISANSPETHSSLTCNNIPALKSLPGVKRNITLGGNGMMMLGSNAAIGTLQGNTTQNVVMNNSKQCTPCQSKNYVRNVLTAINGYDLGSIAAPMLLGDATPQPQQSGGFDFAGILSIVAGLFSGLFSKPAYVDAYHAYYQAVQNMGPAQLAHTTQGTQILASNTAIVAVLLVDYMNPPGANVCTPPGDNYYCGNRAKWADIQPSVQSAAAAVTPFFYWVIMSRANNDVAYINGLSESDIRSLYADYKSHGPMYQQFVAAGGTAGNTGNSPFNTSSTIAGFSLPSLLLIGGAGLLVYNLASKKKKRKAA